MTRQKQVNDAALLARLRSGEQAAFEELVRQHHGAMKRAAAAIIGDAQAEEVVQEAWLAAIRNLSDFEGRSTLKTWPFSILINHARGRLRKAKREVRMEDYGASVEQICNILSISASNSRVLLHRARARVYAMVDQFEETGTC